MIRRFLFSLVLSALLLAAAAPEARAQQFGSSGSAACVGGAIGCEQVDFFLTFVGLTGDTRIDSFVLTLLSPGWLFHADQAGEAEDALGDLSFNPSVGAGSFALSGIFESFVAEVNPFSSVLRLRGQFSNFDADASTLHFQYAAYAGGDLLIAGDNLPGSVVPEPMSMVLLGSGLAGLAAARRRRRREDEDEPTA